MSTSAPNDADRPPRRPEKQTHRKQSERNELGPRPHAVERARAWHETEQRGSRSAQLASAPVRVGRRRVENPSWSPRPGRRHEPLKGFRSPTTCPASSVINRSPSMSALSRSCETTTVAISRSSRNLARTAASPARASSSSPHKARPTRRARGRARAARRERRASARRRKAHRPASDPSSPDPDRLDAGLQLPGPCRHQRDVRQYGRADQLEACVLKGDADRTSPGDDGPAFDQHLALGGHEETGEDPASVDCRTRCRL